MKEIVECVIEKGTLKDLDEITNLYNSLIDHLNSTKNYCGWKKGFYPVRETAKEAIDADTLFVLKIRNDIAGTIVLNHNQEEAYGEVTWGVDAKIEEVIVVRTFAVHPKFLKLGIGERLLSFAEKYAKDNNMKTIRLDTSVGNLPARSLYTKYGFKYVGTVDLKLNIPRFVLFHLYEIVL